MVVTPNPYGVGLNLYRHLNGSKHARLSARSHTLPHSCRGLTAAPFVAVPLSRERLVIPHRRCAIFEPFRWRHKFSPFRKDGECPRWRVSVPNPPYGGWMTSPVAHLWPPLLTKFQERGGPDGTPNGCLMPKRPKFSPFLTHCNCEPYKHAVIFFEKNHFLLYILPSGCLYVVENAITPRVRRVVRPQQTSPSKVNKPCPTSDSTSKTAFSRASSPQRASSPASPRHNVE